MIIHNHPYLGASHTPDIAVAVPILWEGELIGFTAVTAHVLDVGGSYPGINADSFDMYAESKIYNGLKWYNEGVLNEDLDKMVFDNVRTETMNRGDMDAMMAACILGRDRFYRLLEKYGAGRLHVVGVRLDGLLREAPARRDLEAPGRRVRRAHGLARRRRPQPRRAPARRDEDHRPRRSHHDRPDRLERRGADGLQRAVRGVAAGRGVLRDTHAAARPGPARRAGAAERRDLPLRHGGRAQGDDLQPELPARVLLALLPGPARRRQHDRGALGGRPGARDRRQLGGAALLLLRRVHPGEGRVLALPRGRRGRRTAGARAATAWTRSTA